MSNLLLHSLTEFDEIIFALLGRVRPTSILEIGSETGVYSARLFAFCEGVGAELVTVEPSPSLHLVERALTSERFHLYEGTSLAYLEAPGCSSEVALIDGDHNYFTVYNELSLIAAGWNSRGIDGVALLHDVGWPCARRDAYYDPSALPFVVTHPHSFELGVRPGSASLVKGGFRGEGAFAWALHEGGPRNGVLTAVEDFLREHPEFEYRQIDAVFGLGAIARRGGEAARHVAEVFAPYDNELMRRMERNRLDLWHKVIELQDTLRLPTPALAAAPRVAVTS